MWLQGIAVAQLLLFATDGSIATCWPCDSKEIPGLRTLVSAPAKRIFFATQDSWENELEPSMSSDAQKIQDYWPPCFCAQ